jgi:hypothetical protein
MAEAVKMRGAKDGDASIRSGTFDQYFGYMRQLLIYLHLAAPHCRAAAPCKVVASGKVWLYASCI